MSQEALLKAAVPSLASDIVAAGGNLPNIAGLANEAIAENQKKFLETVKGEAVSVIQGATAKIDGLVNAKIAIEKSLAENAKQMAELKRAQDYFAATNNLFPLRKLVGIPTARDILSRYPDIEKVPEGWTAPAAAASTSV